MKHRYIPILLTVILFSCIASCHKPDKMHNQEIRFLPEGDSAWSKAQETLYSDPVFARQLLLHTLDTLQMRDSFDWYIRYNLYVKTFLITSQLDSVELLSPKTVQFCNRQKSLTPRHYFLLTDVYNTIGNRYAISSQNDSALKYFKMTLGYSRKSQNRQSQMTSYNNLADVYVRSGNYSQGAYYFRQMLYLADSLKLPPEELISVYTGLGQTYMELRDFDLSHHYYNLAFQLYDRMDLNQKFVYFTNHGNVYYFQEKYPEALELFKRGYTLVNNSPEYAYAQNICKLNMGEVYMLMNVLDSAQYYLNQCHSYFKDINNQTALYHAETQRLELALKKNDLAEATSILKSEDRSIQTEPSLVSIRRKHLQHYYEEIHDYKKAYQYLKENQQLDDSIRNERIRMRVAEIDLRYKQDTTLMKQTLFIQQQQSSMKSLEQSIFIWILVCALILMIAIFTYIYQKKQRAFLMAKHRNQIVELRMENIRNRISPHFIFNILNRVIGQYKETDSKHQYLYNLIKIMRLNLKLTEKLCIPLEDELDFVNTYLNLEQQQSGDSLHIDMNIDPEIDTKQIQIPSMMIQIPVENAIKHGLRNKEGEKILIISVQKEQNDICILIEDNGSGFVVMANRQDPNSTATGLKVLNQTIHLLNNFNPDPISISIKNRTNSRKQITGCQVRIIIPRHYSYTLPEDK